MLPWSYVLTVCLMMKYTVASAEAASAAWQGLPEGGGGYTSDQRVELGYLLQGNLHNGAFSHDASVEEIEHALQIGRVQHQFAPADSISEHVEVTKPLPFPVVKNVGILVAQPVAIAVPHPIVVGIPQPYPVHIPVAKPVAIPLIKTVAVPVEKKVPYSVEKVIPVPVERHVPIPVEKYIPVPVEEPYPIQVPVYKHVYHQVKSYGHGSRH